VNKNVCVIGGGTAGWITALLINAHYGYNVTVIESEDIGILGAGEGTTPQFITFLEEAKIQVSDLVKHCSATIKHGIDFINWNGDGKSYFHSFAMNNDYYVFNPENILIVAKYIQEGRDYNPLVFSGLLADKLKTGIRLKRKISDVRSELEYLVTYALHFDARKLASYLRDVAISRDVNRIEGKVKTFTTDERNYINSIVLENDSKIKCDFVFDCSGFARLIIGNFYKSKWKSYTDKLPLNSAIPFFLPHDNNVKPQTSAIAMKNGWMWQIPVNGRYGCGYVFDNNRTTADKALLEAEQYFGQKLDSPRAFAFNAGGYQETVINNCMAVGLAQSFVEPLEATSIWISLINLFDFINADLIRNDNPIIKKSFNKACVYRNDQVVEFLHFHYLSERNDSDFWREFKYNHPMTEFQEEMMAQLNHSVLSPSTLDKMWGPSWLMVGLGINQLKHNFREKYLQDADLFKLFRKKEELVKRQQAMLESCLSHKDFIENNF
jgi:tryptophan halogenase